MFHGYRLPLHTHVSTRLRSLGQCQGIAPQQLKLVPDLADQLRGGADVPEVCADLPDLQLPGLQVALEHAFLRPPAPKQCHQVRPRGTLGLCSGYLRVQVPVWEPASEPEKV
jgi:hypothetical protein